MDVIGLLALDEGQGSLEADVVMWIVRCFGEEAVGALHVGPASRLWGGEEVKGEEAVGDCGLECRDVDISSDGMIAVLVSVGGVGKVIGAIGCEAKRLRGDVEMVGEGVADGAMDEEE